MDIAVFKRNMTSLVETGDLALPSTVSPDAFRNAAIVAFQNNPDLRKCNPESIFVAVRELAGMGLMPDGREAAIVPYKGRAQANPMVAGLIKVVRQSGLIASMWADVIYEGETIDVYIEDGERKWDHTNEDGSRIRAMLRSGEIIGAYAAVKFKDGTSDFEPMTREQIEKRRLVSPNQSRSATPKAIWGDWYDEMAKKTVIRALCKRLPLSSEDHSRIDADPTFRDVTPKEEEGRETTQERLARLALERQGETAPSAEPPEVIEQVPFDEELVFPGDDAFTAGAKAFKDGKGCDDNPHDTNPDYSNWRGGWVQAERSAS